MTEKIYNIGNIETANFFGQSLDYQNLKQRIEKKQRDIEIFQKVGETERALEADGELQQLLKQLAQLKESVFKLYETFTKIEINTERLRQAKAYFEQGQFREADAILKAEEMNADLDQLLARQEQLQAEQAKIETSKEQIADEFLIKARLWATFYEKANWFGRVCEYFEGALRAKKTTESLFEYALFLQNHNQFKKALPLYEEALERYRQLAASNPQSYLPDVAMTLNNLANLHKALNEYETALGEYEEALEIYRQLAATNPQSYLPYVATTLNNLANLHKALNEYETALGEYEEALEIYRQLAATNPQSYLPYVATTLNNLAVLHSDRNEYETALGEYEEALEIRRQLAATNPQSYLPDVAMTLNNLAILHSDRNEYETALGEYEEALEIRRQLAATNPQSYLPYVATSLNNLAVLHKALNEYETALGEYEEALEIYRQLAATNPQSYLPDVAMTTINLSMFYQDNVPNRQKSIALAEECIEISKDFSFILIVQRYAAAAQQVLNIWEQK
ncbi:Tetratricopeptide TPR_1 repeat-containing protein [[Leptolyngbya] sp. PCC 7376]|uniref:tetratricopeptide repeat protein n=1 Tax=[Leptolyngbya] sp. PCC 7376 TaxID=111781 RepID=UPI00029F073C|nr:tetratricopeptide repeat protein [[Leptolyngbya] sp. PCC 7376]AFY39741.1 Tetratricopeptide TPR_1 repeat-containing protein [[Leptolyngbya] sp. PCC 7376]